MKKTEVAREVADALHVAELSIDTAISDAKAALARATAARSELGMTGTLGDAGIAKATAAIAALEEARANMVEGHQEGYRILQLLNIRGVGLGQTYREASLPSDERQVA